jgi:hypothetical protein
MNTGFWWENLKERDHIEDLAIDGRIILERLLKIWTGREWAIFVWLRIGTVGRPS